ncbi:MAG: hypothetical protein IKN98_04795 [Bacteroidales bacterium]|nr:hypothetical protein [Bacteroidales bacterium]
MKIQCRKVFWSLMLIFMLAVMSLSCFAQTVSGLRLGSMELIPPPKDLSITKRILHEKLAVEAEKISNRFVNRVGGIAFTQIAEPRIDVHSFNLFCDNEKNAAFVVINGVQYSIPLDIWQLQPIVEYANDDRSNAAFTVFGNETKGESKFLYHKAFIDKLIGLRLMQADLLLASGYLPLEDVGKLPANMNGYVLADSEKYKYSWVKTESNEQKSLDAVLRLYSSKIYVHRSNSRIPFIEDTKNMREVRFASYATYILTDFNEPISFDIKGGVIKIVGRPYYRFFYNADTAYRCGNAGNSFMKEHYDWLYEMNPVVMDATVTVCQWSAFFRYAKKYFPNNWKIFLKQVREFKDDAPEVYTPIALIKMNDETLSREKYDAYDKRGAECVSIHERLNNIKVQFESERAVLEQSQQIWHNDSVYFLEQREVPPPQLKVRRKNYSSIANYYQDLANFYYKRSSYCLETVSFIDNHIEMCEQMIDSVINCRGDAVALESEFKNKSKRENVLSQLYGDEMYAYYGKLYNDLYGLSIELVNDCYKSTNEFDTLISRWKRLRDEYMRQNRECSQLREECLQNVYLYTDGTTKIKDKKK